MNADEVRIIGFLNEFPDEYVSVIDVSRKLGKGRRYKEDRTWALPIMRRMEMDGLLETNNVGDFRVRTEYRDNGKDQEKSSSTATKASTGTNPAKPNLLISSRPLRHRAFPSAIPRSSASRMSRSRALRLEISQPDKRSGPVGGLNFGGEHEIAFRQAVDFVGPDRHPHFAPGEVNVRMMVL